MPDRHLRHLSREQARELDRIACEDLGIPSICLMENAGAGAARIVERALGRRGRVVCLAGPGGNGGDAMVLARHLAGRRFAVEVILLGDRAASLRSDTATQAAICLAMRLPIRRLGLSGRAETVAAQLRGADFLVDGLYGTGLTRPLGRAAAALVRAMNTSRAPVLALDLPSGLDCDTGEPLGPCVRADMTATFAAPKLGFANPASRAFTGRVYVVPTGAPLASPPR